MKTRTIILTKMKRGAELLSETFLTVLFLAGICISLQDLFYTPLCMWTALAAGLLFLITVQFAAMRDKNADQVKRVWYVAELLAFLAGTSWISQGFLAEANQFLYLWNGRFGTEIGSFQVNGRAGTGAVLIWGLLGMAIASALLGQIQKRRLGRLAAGAAVPFAFGCICGRSSMWLAVIVLCAAVFGLFCYDTGAVYRFRPGELLLTAGVILAASGLGMAATGYGRSAGLEKWKQGWKEQVEAFRYGEDTLPQGDLTVAKDLLNGEEERLRVEMQQPVELYLRGFVGDTYGRNQWLPLSYLNYQDEYAGMLKWLETEKLIPVTQYMAYQKISGENFGITPETSAVQIENTGAFRKYVYLPATAVDWVSAGSRVRKDHNVQSGAFFGAENYSFTMTAEEQTADKVVYADWLGHPGSDTENTYLDAEAVYHAFTDTFYKEVPEETETLIQEIFFPDGTENQDFQEITTQIRQILRMQMQYREYPDTGSGNGDLLTEFLEGGADGNAAAFASAAVMAYRVAGYPARYVEGYHLSEAQAAEMVQSGENTVVLTTKNAHAWVEVYMTGAGWMPVEVVPGMYTETYTTEKVEGRPAYQVNSVSEDNGVDTSRQAKEKSGGSGSEAQNRVSLRGHFWILESVILLGYLLLAVYLILELQRAVRIRILQRRQQKHTDEAEDRILRIRRLLTIGKIKGDYSRPLELLEQIQSKYPDIREEEYHHIVELIQKARFGGKEWKKSEQRAIDHFIRHLEKCLYEQSGRIRRWMLRYFWII